jgi:hypothetical protein
MAVLLAVAAVEVAGCRRLRSGGGSAASAAPPSLGHVVCWGLRQVSGSSSDRLSTVAAAADATALFAGFTTTCARGPTGALRCWGQFQSPLDDLPASVLTADTRALSFSTQFACATLGSGAARCWGSNLVGQLGNGAAPDPHTQVRMGVNAAGEVTVQSPLPSTGRSTEPVAVTGLDDASLVRTGGSHACALRRSGAVLCWGNGRYGTLGDGTSGYDAQHDRPMPVPTIDDATALSVGINYTCVLRRSGGVWCWGTLTEEYPRDSREPVLVLTPTRIAGVDDAVDLAVGEREACARNAAGMVRCWDERLGVREVAGLGPVAQVVAGRRHFCARRADGQVWCWGENEHGQLGVEGATDSAAAVAVTGLTDVVELTAGSSHTCARRR